MKQIRQLQKSNGIQSEQTVIHSAFNVNEENVKLDVIIFEESSDTKVLRIAPIRHHTNLTAKPKLMEYKGPGLLSCTIGPRTAREVSKWEPTSPSARLVTNKTSGTKNWTDEKKAT